jgi:O-antigen/teichoic acid export membrane protein
MTSAGILQGLDWRQLRSALGFHAIDVSLPGGNSKRRDRRVLLSAVTGPITGACGLLAFLITVPLTIRYLGPERYGAWMSISALMAFLRFSDLGLGNGLVGAVSQAEGRGDRGYAQRAISSVLVFLCAISILILVGFPISALGIHWDAVLGLSHLQDRGEIQTAILVFVALYAISIPISLGQQVQRALQQGYISNLWTTLGSLLSFTGVYVAAMHHARIPWLVAIIGGVPLLPALANSVVLYTLQRPDLRPSLSGCDRAVGRELLSKGMLFFGLGVAGALAYDSQNILIAHILGPAAVGVYAVVQRLFSAIPMLVAYVTMPLWPAFGDALGRRDWHWIPRALKRGMAVNALMAIIPAILLTSFSGAILLHWTHGAITAPGWLIAGFAVWSVTSAVSAPISMLLNAAHVLWFQIVTCILYGLLTIGSILWVLPSTGLPGAVWSMTILYIAVVLAPGLIYVRLFVDRLATLPVAEA